VLVQHARDEKTVDLTLELETSPFRLTEKMRVRAHDLFSVYSTAGWIAEGGLCLTTVGRLELTRIAISCAAPVVDDLVALVYGATPEET
jgi:hypothetical protein